MKNSQKNNLRKLSEKVDAYKDEIAERNFKNFKSFSFGGMILTGLISMTALIFYGRVFFTREYEFFFGLFVICNLYIYCFLRKHIQYTLVSFYVALAPILAIGILMGSFLDPESNAMTIMIMLCTLFMFIIDKPHRIINYILGTSIVFLICSYLCKSSDMFIADFVNLAIYLSVGLSVNMLTVRDRIKSVENYSLAVIRASSDALTSILNRGAGDSLVMDLMNHGTKGTFLIADIDDFKYINDTYGHQIGDEVIREVSQKLKSTFRGEDVVWRLGGDEFAVFAVNLLSREICEKRLEDLQKAVSNIKASREDPIKVHLSIGCVICSQQSKFDIAYKSSDAALYEAKRNGKNGYVFWE